LAVVGRDAHVARSVARDVLLGVRGRCCLAEVQAAPRVVKQQCWIAGTTQEVSLY